MKFTSALSSFFLVASANQAAAFSVAPSTKISSTSRIPAFTASNENIRSHTALNMAWEVDEESNTLTVTPIKSLDGTVTLPGSKSLSNRCLLLAALSDGNTKVENLLESDDIRYMLEALDHMKVPVERDPNDPTTVTVTGQNGPINAPSDEVLGWAEKEKFVKGPLGLNGATGKPVSKYTQILLKPKNHRFASYASVLKKFP